VDGPDADAADAPEPSSSNSPGGGGGAAAAMAVGAGAPPLPSVTDYDGSAMDNRDYSDTNTAQKLTHEDLAALKAEGKTGQAIIQVRNQG